MNFAALQQSLFLQALGEAILNSLWQGFIIWIIYETINVFYKNATSSFKNNLSILLIFIAFTWFISSFIAGVFNNEKLLSMAGTSKIMVQASPDKSGFNIQSLISYTAGSLPYLSVSYIFLLLFLMAKLLSAYRFVYFIARKRLINPPLALQHFAFKVAEEINISKKISVWISHYIDVPATIGFLKPIILIPFASINSLTAHQLEAIILHELSHIKRNDYITNLIISVIETVLFFNPFILLLVKVIKRERENCCDDFVIQYRYDPHSYASALLSLEQSRTSNLHLAIGAVSGKKQLLTRIKRITNSQAVSRQFNYGQKLLALLLVTGIICSVAWLSPHEKKKVTDQYEVKNIKAVTNSNREIQNKQSEIITQQQTTLDDKALKEPLQKNGTLSAIMQSDTFVNPPADRPDNRRKSEIDMNDFTAVNPEFASDINLNSNSIFDRETFKFKPFKSLPSFKLENLDININVDELNRDLKKAYKEINDMDWGKIQHDIKESLSKIDAKKLVDIEISELNKENAKKLLEIRSAEKKKNNNDILLNLLRNEILSRDSLQKIITPSNDSHFKLEKMNELSDPGFEEAGSNVYNYSYERSTLPEIVSEKHSKKNLKTNFTTSNLNNRNVRIIVNRLTHVFEENKKYLHYSSASNLDKKDSQQKVVSIEITDNP